MSGKHQAFVVDDRGAEHPLLDLKLPRATVARHRSFRLTGEEEGLSPLERSVRARAVVRFWEETDWRLGPRLGQLARSPAGWLSYICFVGLAAMTNSPPTGAIMAVVIPSLLALNLAANRQLARKALASLHGLPPACLACHNDLSGLNPDEDGCRVCPDCGAAWRD